MKIQWEWSAHGGCFHGKPHEEIARICREAGFGGVEGNHAMFEGDLNGGLGKARKIYEGNGVRMATFHLPFTIEDDIASFYESIRKEAVKNAVFWMEQAAELGAGTGIMHPTTSRLDADTEGVRKYMEQLGKSLKTLLRRAEKLSFTIALENMLPGEHTGRFGSRAGHFELFIKEFSHPNLGFCFDSGHALVSSREEAGELLEVMSPYIKAFHLQDNAGDRDSHLAPGRGLVKWKQIFSKMRAIGFSGYACIEAPPFAYGPDYSLSAWKALAAETGRLAGEKRP